jgi:hypothetical protein
MNQRGSDAEGFTEERIDKIEILLDIFCQYDCSDKVNAQDTH